MSGTQEAAAQWGTPGYVSDAGLVPADMSDAEWKTHETAYFARIANELRQGERPIAVEPTRTDLGDPALDFHKGTDGYEPYGIWADWENDNPGYAHRPYLVPQYGEVRDADPVPLPFGFAENDHVEAAAIVRAWIVGHRNGRR
jgi:hypothetical protein